LSFAGLLEIGLLPIDEHYEQFIRSLLLQTLCHTARILKKPLRSNDLLLKPNFDSPPVFEPQLAVSCSSDKFAGSGTVAKRQTGDSHFDATPNQLTESIKPSQ
jgi:hypothetical protein